MPFHPFWGEGSPTKIDYRTSSGDIPNSMRCSFQCSHHTAALAEPRGTLMEPSWNPRGTLVEPSWNPYLRTAPDHPEAFSGLRPQSFQLLGKKVGSFILTSLLEQGSLKDTFCNHLKHVAFSTKIKLETTIYKLQCSGVFHAASGSLWRT